LKKKQRKASRKENPRRMGLEAQASALEPAIVFRSSVLFLKKKIDR